MYKISLDWPSDDAGCLQRLEVQTPHQKLRLVNDFTPEAGYSSLAGGKYKVIYFDKPCSNLPRVRHDYDITCLGPDSNTSTRLY